MTASERHNAKVSGAGERAMVFAHGFGCDQNMWRLVAPAFERGLPRRPVRPRRRRRLRPLRLRSREIRQPRRLRRRRRRALPRARRPRRRVRRPLGERHGRRARRQARAGALRRPRPGRARRRATSTTAGYVGGFSEAQVHELLDFLDSNHMGWSQRDGADDHGQRRPPGARRGADQQLLPHRPRDRQAVRPHHLPRPTTAPTSTACAARCLVLQCSEDVIAPRAVGEYVHRRLPDSSSWSWGRPATAPT